MIGVFAPAVMQLFPCLHASNSRTERHRKSKQTWINAWSSIEVHFKD